MIQMSNCLPPMHDGRMLTRMKPVGSDAPLSTYYREQMIKNATQIIQNNQRAACEACCECLVTYGPSGRHTHDSPPYLYSSVHETTKPIGYQNSNMKAEYLSSEALNERLYTPTWTQDQILAAHLPNFN